MSASGSPDPAGAPARSPWLPPEQPVSPEASQEPGPTSPPETSAAGAPTEGSIAHPAPSRPRETARIDIPRWLAVVVGLLLAGALAAAAVFAMRDRTTPAPGPAPAAATPAPIPVVRSVPALLKRQPAHALRDPFIVDGARWAVFVHPAQPWTNFIHQVPPAAGRRWLLVTVRVRTVDRTDLDPAALAYRVRDTSGALTVPDLRFGTGPQSRQSHPLARDGLGQAKLAFQVRQTATQLTLTFPSRTRGGQTIVIPLGNA